MKLKNAFWTLAVALAVVSCSDELDENGGGSTITAEDGEGVYLTVNIATPTGAATKASQDAEDGDDFLEGSEGERQVHNINIYLLEATDGDTGSGASAINSEETGLKAVNAAGTTKIVGHGFSETVIENGHNGSIHHTANTVKLKVNEVPTTETVYHVLAVTNLGKEVNFSTLGELRDAVGTTGDNSKWNGNAFAGNGVPGSTSKFVMSTHQMWDATLSEGSSVSISPENMDENNPAQATVYVERLAARIDLGLTEDLIGAGEEEKGDAVKNPVKVEGSENESVVDYVKLTGYQVINRWNGDNYMLKRVTGELTGAEGAYPSIDASSISYLGDEIYNSASNKYNYVLDPATTGTGTIKNAANLTALADSYLNHYDVELNETITTAFTTLTGFNTTEDSFTPVMYTKENCLDLNNQIAGLSTGIIFQGNYTPNAVSEFTTEGGTAAVEANSYTANEDFYVINDFIKSDASRFLTADLTTIGALSFESISTEDYSSDLMKALFDATTNNWGSVTLDNLKTAVAGMIGGKINMTYKEYLEELITPTTGVAPSEIDDITLTSAKWSAFLTDASITAPSGDDWATASKALYDKYNVSYYKGGVCYFPFYIRHEDNGVASQMGPMEYCIVRNNVYQVEVSGVNALGYPLPFITPGETPVEEENVFLQVQIYVKDWTLRKNSSIIL